MQNNNITIRLPEELRRKVKKAAKENYTNESSIIRKALSNSFENPMWISKILELNEKEKHKASLSQANESNSPDI